MLMLMLMLCRSRRVLALGATLLLAAAPALAASLRSLDDLPSNARAAWPRERAGRAVIADAAASVLGRDAGSRVQLPIRDPTPAPRLGPGPDDSDARRLYDSAREDWYRDYARPVPDARGEGIVPAVPEPAAALAFGLGLLLAGMSRLRRRASRRAASPRSLAR